MLRRRLAALYLVADGVHQVGLAHAHAAVEEERIVGLGGALGHGQRGGAGKLVAVADDEGIEGVARVELRRGGPVEARLLRRARRRRRRRRGRVRRNRAEAAIPPLRRNRGVLLGGHKAHVVELQRLQVDGLLNQVAVLVADVLKLRRGHAHIERAAGDVAVARGLEPGLEGLADDLLFEGRENLEPGIECCCRRSCKCHRADPCLRLCITGSVHPRFWKQTLSWREALAFRQNAVYRLPGCRWSAPEFDLGAVDEFRSVGRWETFLNGPDSSTFQPRCNHPFT